MCARGGGGTFLQKFENCNQLGARQQPVEGGVVTIGVKPVPQDRTLQLIDPDVAATVRSQLEAGHIFDRDAMRVRAATAAGGRAPELAEQLDEYRGGGSGGGGSGGKEGASVV